MSYLLLKYLHILGAAVLFGTGLGIAFFMFMAQKSGEVRAIAATSLIVVKADFLFTMTAAILQPVTGGLLVIQAGHDFTDIWILFSLGLYALIGLCWVPVIFMQIEMRDLAMKALAEGTVLPTRFHRLYRLWFVLGWPAFFAMLIIFWLMIERPVQF